MRDLQEADEKAGDQALGIYRTLVRRCLTQTQGYECQAAEGEFMLAFHEAAHAVDFCLLVDCTRPVLHFDFSVS